MITTSSYKPFKKETIDYSKLIVTNKAASNYDPTKTTGLRNAFVRQMDIRFNALKSLIGKAIIEQDCFGLITSSGNINFNSASRADAPDSLPGHRAFAFSRNPEKMDSFMSWLDSQEKAGILTTTKINQLGSAAETPWTNIYIQDSYKRGVQRATYEMGKEGIQLPNDIPAGLQASINTPFHIDRVGLLYTRTFSDLKGITKAMDTRISQILAQGLVDGDNPRTLAKKINDQVDGIGKARARTLARTEIIRAHHAGMIGEYRNYGIAGVKVKAEWVTAGFNVCPKCQSNEGKVYTLDEIEGMIPFHPNCRCMALPIVDESKVKETPKVEIKPTAENNWAYMQEKGWKTDKWFKPDVFKKKYNASLKNINISEIDGYMDDIAKKYDIKWEYKAIEDGFRPNQMDVKFRGTYDGKPVNLVRSFYVRDKQQWVEHELFSIPEALQGKGMSKEVLSSFYKVYDKAGINHISIHANIDVGGYAWGKYGFSSTKESAMALLKSEKGKAHYSAAKREFDEYFKNNPTANYFPMNIWAYSDYGKEMLLGSDWSGVLNLANKVSKNIFESYLGY